MAKTGVSRWDNLPGRVGIADVDALRAAYKITRDKVTRESGRLSEIKERLDHIWIKWKKDGDKDETI